MELIYRKSRFLALVLVVALFGAACGSSDDDSGSATSTTLSGTSTTEGADDNNDDANEAKYGGSLVVGISAETNTWTPGLANLAASGMTVAHAIYDPLVWLNSNGEFVGYLAESIEANEDITAWTLKLREGVTFHDGTALDAEVVKWNFDNLHFAPTSQSYGYLVAAKVDNLEVIDPLTVRYNLTEANSAFPDLLRGGPGLVVSQAAYEADPDGFGDHPVGTGPFMMKEWRRDDRAVVTRNENYWMKDANGDQLPYLDQITFRPIPDGESRYQALMAGDIDVIQTNDGTDIANLVELSSGNDFAVTVVKNNSAGAILLNVLVPPMDDVRIRQALLMAGDSEAAREVLGTLAEAEAATGFYASDSPWYSAEAAQVYNDLVDAGLDKAVELVEAYKADPARSDGGSRGDPVEITYTCATDPTLAILAQLQQSLWARAGINTTLESLDEGTMVTNVVGGVDTEPPFKGTYMANCWQAGGGLEDPLSTLGPFFGAVASSPGNFTNYTNAAIDEEIDVLRTSDDFATRYGAVEKIQKVVASEVPIIWSSQSISAVGYRATIVGIADWTLPSGEAGTGNPDGTMRFHQVALAQ